MEQIVFPVPSICEFLTKESKLRIYYTTERDEQGSKINDFFLRSEDLFNEMNWQKKLRGACPPPLFPPRPQPRGSQAEPQTGACAAGEQAPAPGTHPESTLQKALWCLRPALCAQQGAPAAA